MGPENHRVSPIISNMRVTYRLPSVQQGILLDLRIVIQLHQWFTVARIKTADPSNQINPCCLLDRSIDLQLLVLFT